MTKRQKLNFNSEELTQNLKTSTGLGMNAFFTPSSPPPPAASSNNKQPINKDEMGQAARRPGKQYPLKSLKPATSTGPKNKTVRPVRPERAGSKDGLQSKQHERDEYWHTLSKQPDNREIKRHAFEVYKDQVERLQELKVATMKTGHLRSMSDMVREALDNFLRKQS